MGLNDVCPGRSVQGKQAVVLDQSSLRLGTESLQDVGAHVEITSEVCLSPVVAVVGWKPGRDIDSNAYFAASKRQPVVD